MRLEKQIEKRIYNYLNHIWAVVECNNSWTVMIKKGWYNHRMTLQKAWCPDITALYNGKFYWIEVKKNQKEVDHWKKQEARYDNWETIPKSYSRELDQIKYRNHIIDQGWIHLVTCDLEEVQKLIN